MKNLILIKKWMKINKINFLLVNRTDEFLNEYIASYAERLKWISNFSGSAGRAIITQKKSYLFVDGRYTLQAKKEVNKKYFEILSLENFWLWLQKKIKKDFILSIDPKLLNNYEFEKIEKIINLRKAKISFLEKNPIDIFWLNQPFYPKSRAFLHDEKFSGKSLEKKLHIIQMNLKKNSIDFYILSSLDSIAWLLNIRGDDIPYTPLLLSYAIIPKKGNIDFFVEHKKIVNIKKSLLKKVNFHKIDNLDSYINKINKNSIIGMDKFKTNYQFNRICKKNKLKILYLLDPCTYPKAEKNKTEIIGAKNANIRDGITITKFLYWLKNKVDSSKMDEISAANFLYNLRKKNKYFFSSSFDTISAIGKNSALPHYRVNINSNLKFKKNEIYLFDSGGQYYDGTTDITRTVILGRPNNEQKDRFTRVLKGHIALCSAEFGPNIKGSSLDYLARKSLLEIGCDYEHGTGHGIGSFLSVHEGPQKISKFTVPSEGYLKEGMILSNEPGFYKKNKYGIRIENLIYIKKKTNNNFYFETISFAPIDVDLIEIKLLNEKEKKWINKYHQKVYNIVGKHLNNLELRWLEKVTKPL